VGAARSRLTSVPAGRVFGVAGGTALATLSQVVLLSTVARQSSDSVWSALAIGQSIGQVAGIACAFGWNLSGPTRWAGSRPEARASLYVDSLVNRVLVTVVVLPISVAIGVFLTPPGQLRMVSLTIVATLTLGLSPNWFNVAEGRAGAMALYNFLPRSAASLVAAALIWFGSPPETYPIALLIQSLGATSVFTAKVVRHATIRIAPLLDTVGTQWQTAVTDFSGGVFSAANVALVASQVTVAELASYSSAQRVYQLGIIALLVLSQSLQGWTVDPSGDRTQRGRQALRAHALLGLVGGLFIGLAGPTVSSLLFGDQLAAPHAVTVALAFSFLFIACNTGIGVHVLIPHGDQRIVLRATLTASAVGIPGVLTLAHFFGETGGAVGLALSQLGALVVLLPQTRRILFVRS